MIRIPVLITVILLGTAGSTRPPTRAPAADGVEVTRTTGGTIKTDLGHGIILNKDSTLTREWIAINQAGMPVKFQGTPGISTAYKSDGSYSGKYVYTTDFKIEVAEPIAALEIRFLTFDVWGEHGTSLSMTKVQDFLPATHRLDGTWNLFSEHEASEFYASIAYVARARTRDGKVITADVRQIVDEAKKLSAKFTETDLEPDKPNKQPK